MIGRDSAGSSAAGGPQDSPDPLNLPDSRGPGLLRRIWDGITGARRMLRHIQVEVTSFCPGACAYCPRGAHAGSWRARHMPAGVFAALRPLLLRSDRAHLQGWGEPLLHPRFLDFVAFARRAGCAVSSTSCGLRMDADLAAGIVRGGMDILAFSLAGTDERSNAIRRNVPFGRVIRAFELMREAKRANGGAGPALRVAYLLLADRVDAARRLPALMRDLDIPECVISTLDMPVLSEHRALAFAPEEREKICAAAAVLEEISREAERDGRVIRHALPGDRPVMGGCREQVHESLHVDADGAVSPCIYVNVPAGGMDAADNPHVFGRIGRDDPLAVWEGRDFADFRGDVANGAPPPPCRACPRRFESFAPPPRPDF